MRERFHSRSDATAALLRLSRRETILFTELDPQLRRAVLVHWGSMAGARRALRLRPPEAPRQFWSRERVVEEIVKLHRRGQHLSVGAVVRAGRNDLVVAAQRYAGGWGRARSLAGVGFKRRSAASSPVWDHAAVIQEIRTRWRDGLSLAVTKAPKSLTSAAIRMFGSWRVAIEESGFNYDDIRLSRTYDDAELLAWLRALARAKPWMTLFDLDKYGEHAVVCRRRWGSFEAAAEAAGLRDWPVRLRHRALSRADVLRALRKRSASNQPTSFAAVRRGPDGNFLVNSVLHHFASWADALAAAGIRPRPPRS
jgi:hypothetical protein